MFSKKKSLLLSLLLVLLLLFTACGNSGGKEGSASQEDNKEVIVRLEGGDYGLPQPFTSYSRGPGTYKVKLVFDSLIAKDNQGMIPWLAKDWEVKDEGKKYVFKLRDDVKWSDGEQFTAEDVHFTYNYIQNYPPAGSSGVVLKGGIVNEIKILNDYELEINLSESNPNFLEAAISINIIPKHIWEGVDRPDEFTGPESLIGTGPFLSTSYSKEHGTYRFEAREDFWGPKPAVDVIEFIPVSDSVLALENGDIDLSSIPVDSLNIFKDKEEFSIMENPGVWGYRLRFNISKVSVFENKELRQAFAYAIDRQDIVDKVARGAGIVGSMGILPESHLDFNPNLVKYEKNIVKAEELLAGLNIDSAKLEFELLVGEGLEVRMGELIKEYLSDIGVKVNLVSVDTKTRDSRIANGDYQLVITGHGGWARDADYLRTRFEDTIDDWSNGTPGYKNALFSELIEEQLTEMDENKRKKIFMEIQEILAEDIPEIPLYMRTGFSVYRNTTHSGWMYEFDHHEASHNKLSFLDY